MIKRPVQADECCQRLRMPGVGVGGQITSALVTAAEIPDLARMRSRCNVGQFI